MAGKILTVLAYWVVFGLPFLLAWRLYQLFRAKNQPKRFYIGGLIFYFGIAVWIPFAYFRRIAGVHIPVAPFLIAHLIGTFAGARLKRGSASQIK